MHQKLIVAILGALVSVTLLGSSASADLRLRIEDIGTGQGAVITDGGAGDVNAAVGVLTFIGVVGSFTINVTTGISKPIIGGVTDLGQLDLNSVNATGSSGGTLRLTLEDTNYLAAPFATLHVIGEVGGTLSPGAGNTITIQSWTNGDNLVPDLGSDQGVGPIGAIGSTPAGSVPAWAAAFVSGPGAFSSSSSGDFNNGADSPFSLFNQVTINFTGVGSVSFDESQRVVPEPTSLLLLSAGVAGLGLMTSRKRQRRNA
jgi:hypothetical protein